MHKLFLTFIYVVFLTFGMVAQNHSRDHGDHDGHAHHHGHNTTEQNDHHGHNHEKKQHTHTHQGHDHSGHNHDHSGHDHSGHNHDHSGHSHAAHASNGKGHGGHGISCGHHDSHADFDPGKTAIHHISDQNIYSIGPFHIPLPCMLYVPGEGFNVFSSGRFDADAHGIGSKAHNGFVLYNGAVRRVTDPGFPMQGEVDLGPHNVHSAEVAQADGSLKDVVYVCLNNKAYKCDNKSTGDAGLFGGGITSFYDFSLTKNVVSMMLVCLLLIFLFSSVAKHYRNRDGKEPTGIQGVMEPLFVFIQDEVAKPFLGNRWKEFTPLLMSIFFFILGLNLFGQVPFFGGSNVTGNLSVTLVLAVITFIVTNINGNSHYWGHIFNMPGVPWPVKLFVVTPVEILGLFIKPVTLMLRLFGNMIAGHMVIVIFVGLIFIFGRNGANPAAAWGTSIGSGLLTLFMMAIELLVAFLQAFVFTILTASYIGAAVEDHHHEEHDDAHAHAH